jgi:hypothetical protein
MRTDTATLDITCVDARISIEGDTGSAAATPSVTVEKDVGDGAGFVPAAGVTVTPSESGVGSITGGTCTTGDTDASGQCTIIVNSNAAGQSTVNASATVDVEGLNIPVATNGSGAFTVDNVKTWVNAKISITPASDLNPVGTTHTLTCTIEINAGDGAGFVDAPDGTLCDADITDGPGSFVGDGDDCLVDGGDGNCTIVITQRYRHPTVVAVRRRPGSLV